MKKKPPQDKKCYTALTNNKLVKKFMDFAATLCYIVFVKRGYMTEKYKIVRYELTFFSCCNVNFGGFHGVEILAPHIIRHQWHCKIVSFSSVITDRTAAYRAPAHITLSTHNSKP